MPDNKDHKNIIDETSDLTKTSELLEIPENPQIKNQIPDNQNAFLQKKFSYLKRKIILGLISFGGLIFIIAIIQIYYSDINKTSEAQIKQIENYVANIRNKTNDLQSKVTDAKKYKEVWKSAKAGQRKFDGININQVNEDLTNLSNRYHIINPTLKISVPEVLKGGIFDRSTLDISLSSVSMNYDALTDVIAIAFIKDFIANLPGYVVIHDFSIKRSSETEFTNADLVNISTGKFMSGVNVRVEISWYILKKKANILNK